MAINLLDLLKQIFGDNFAALAAKFLGESEDSTKSALTAMVPALLGAVVQKGSTSEGASSLMSLLNSPQVDANLTGNISQLLGGGQSNAGGLLNSGSAMLNSLLGDKAGAFGSTLSSLSGISGSSASSLLAMAVPMVMGTLKKFVGEQGLSAGGLMSLLGSQASHLQNAIDPRLGQAVNIRLPGVGAVASAATSSAQTAGAQGNKVLPWIIGLIALLILLWVFRSCSATDAANKTAQAAQATQDAAAAAAKKAADAAQATKDAAAAAAKKTADAAGAAAQRTAAAIRSVELPGGMKMDVPQGGFIDSLVVFLSKPDWASGKSFAFDNVTFETNSATLTPASGAQMTQLANVLKAYPNVIVLVEGHTDNTGDAAANKKLSEDRAAAVRAVLVGMGMPANRVNSAGWGQEKPIASNDTEDGKAKNRRVEITLSK